MAALAGVFRKAGVGNRWMWLSLDVTLVLLGSRPVLMRTHLDMEWLPLLGRAALSLMDNITPFASHAFLVRVIC